MNDLLSKLMQKRGADQDIDPDYKNSKMAVLSQLMQEMSKMEAGGLATPKKVVVAAPDAAGLSAGLAKAQDLVDPAAADSLSGDADAEDEDAGAEGDNHEHEADDSDPEAASGMSHTGDDSMDAMSPEDLQAQIQKLQALLAAHSLK